MAFVFERVGYVDFAILPTLFFASFGWLSRRATLTPRRLPCTPSVIRVVRAAS